MEIGLWRPIPEDPRATACFHMSFGAGNKPCLLVRVFDPRQVFNMQVREKIVFLVRLVLRLHPNQDVNSQLFFSASKSIYRERSGKLISIL